MLDSEQDKTTLYDRSVAAQRSAVFSLGGLEFYGVSGEFNNITNLCDDFVHNAVRCAMQGSQSRPLKCAVLLDSGYGKTTMSKAIVTELSAKEVPAIAIVQSSDLAILVLPKGEADHRAGPIVVDDLPKGIAKRSAALKKINQWRGPVFLFCKPEYGHDEGISAFSEIFQLRPIDNRLDDKMAFLLCLLVKEAEIRWPTEPEIVASTLNRIPWESLEACVELITWAGHLGDLEILVARILDELDLLSIGGDESMLPSRKLRDCFRETLSAGATSREHMPDYRIWVEGVTDKRLLELAAHLAQKKYGVDYMDGLSIESMGGTTKLSDILRENQISPEQDLFLFDNDEDGRHAQENVKKLDHKAQILPDYFLRKNIPTDKYLQIEIEDLVNVDLIDCFFKENSQITPEYEGLYYKDNKKRRLVVMGEHKELLIDWIANNANLEDIERIFYVFCLARNFFPLPERKSDKEMKKWRLELCNPDHSSNNPGLRPEPWWPFALG